jgi:methyl-accepting chemotaxis protein
LAAISEENAAASQTTMDSAQNVGDTMEELQKASQDLLRLSDVLKEGLVIFKL